jgi:RND superfamily putative drug exporter
MGLSVLVFQEWLGDPGITFWLAPFLFVILIALGADYNIFIMSRVREELATSDGDVGEAVCRGLLLTGRVITSAGIILAGTFAVLMVAPLPNLRQIGFAVTVGVLIDTFVVRSLLVPSITVLLGRWAFWPGWKGDSSHGLALVDPEAIASPPALASTGTPNEVDR